MEVDLRELRDRADRLRARVDSEDETARWGLRALPHPRKRCSQREQRYQL